MLLLGINVQLLPRRMTRSNLANYTNKVGSTVTARKDGTSWLSIRLPEPMVHGDLILVPLLVH